MAVNDTMSRDTNHSFPDGIGVGSGVVIGVHFGVGVGVSVGVGVGFATATNILSTFCTISAVECAIFRFITPRATETTTRINVMTNNAFMSSPSFIFIIFIFFYRNPIRSVKKELFLNIPATLIFF